MKIIAHAKVASECPLSVLNALYPPHGAMIEVLAGDDESPFEPTVMINGVELYRVVTGRATPMHCKIISDVILTDPRMPHAVREGFLLHSMVLLPRHWVTSIVTGAVIEGAA